MTRIMPFSPMRLFWLAAFAGFIAIADAFLVCQDGSICSCRSANQCPASVLRLSYDESESASPEYRSIADVVGGLHGGKYQFGGDMGAGIPDSAFSGLGETMDSCTTSENSMLDKELPNWAKKLAPSESQTTSPLVLSVPSNANPMDGMVYFASVDIQNQERTWETFYAKLMSDSNGVFVDLPNSQGIVVSPTAGSLAPRGGASNACDASKPYSDTATIRVTQSSDHTTANSSNDVWLVIGTEEEQWAYKLELL